MGCCDKPSVVRRAAAMAVSGTVGLARVGLRIGIAPAREIERRRAICRDCAIAIKDAKTGRAKWCGRMRDAANGTIAGCGCLLAAKTQLIDAACPVGKWGSGGQS